MTRYSTVILLLIGLWSLSAQHHSAYGQEARAGGLDLRPDYSSAHFHVGTGTGTQEGPTLAATMEFWTPYGLFALRNVSSYETLALFPSKKPVEKTGDVGLMYGWKVDFKPPNDPLVSVTFATGISVATRLMRGELVSEGAPLFGSSEYEPVREHRIGLPYEARITFGEKFALNASLYGNANGTESYYGVMLGLTLQNQW